MTKLTPAKKPIHELPSIAEAKTISHIVLASPQETPPELNEGMRLSTHLQQLSRNIGTQLSSLSEKILDGKIRRGTNEKSDQLDLEIRRVDLAHEAITEFLHSDDHPELSQLAKKRTWLTALTALQPVVYPVLTGQFVNSLISDSPISIVWGALLVTAPILIKRAQVSLDYCNERMIDHCMFGERSALVRQFHQLDFKERLRTDVQDQLEAARSHPFRTREFVDARYNRLANAVILTGTVIAMAQVNLPVALLVGAGVIPLLRLERRKAHFTESMRSKSVKIHKKLWPSFFDLTDIDIVPQIKSMLKSDWAAERIENLSDSLISLYKKLADGGLKSNLAASRINAVTTAIAGSWIVYQAFLKTIPGGDAIQFFGSLGALQISLATISSVSGHLSQNAPYVNRCFSFTKIWRKLNPPEKTYSQEEILSFKKKLEENPIGIHLKNVKVIHEEKTILDIEDLKINAGELVGIVGVRGAGKSTLIKSILGLEELAQGNISLLIGEEEFDIEDIPLESWHAVVGYSPQDGYEGRSLTVLERINLGINELCTTAHSIESVMDVTGAEQFIGVNEVDKVTIGANIDKKNQNRKFSGGEQQTIVNCAALIGNHSVLILDEPTARLDSDNEEKLINELKSKTGDKLRMLISHRLKNTIDAADTIIVLDGGKVQGVGTHQELIKDENSIYRHLYTKQNGDS